MGCRGPYRRRDWRHWLGWVGGAFALAWLLSLSLQLRLGSLAPVDGVLVLGGSIRREIYVAQAMAQTPQVPILISQGSPDPCIRRIFQATSRGLGQVWLEHCAQSTFDNFVFALPLLHRWNVRHVKVVTSPTHLPRAQWMAQLLLGAHGIWVEMDIVTETGVPGNQESPLKTTLDLARSLVWILVSQVYHPTCDQVQPLAAVDLEAWAVQGYHCEHQGGLD